jgi:hypothetical protein
VPALGRALVAASARNENSWVGLVAGGLETHRTAGLETGATTGLEAGATAGREIGATFSGQVLADRPT